MNKEVKEAFALRRKLVILEYAKAIGNAAEAYRFFEVPKSTFYVWKKAFALEDGMRRPTSNRDTMLTRFPVF